MAFFVALLLTMAGSRIFHSYFSILSNCLPGNMWQSFIVWATTSSPTGWNADLKGNNQEWQGVILETGWRTANYNEEHRRKMKVMIQWWYRNDEHIKAMHISDKNNILRWKIYENTMFADSFFCRSTPPKNIVSRPTPEKTNRNTEATWILFRAEGTCAANMIAATNHFSVRNSEFFFFNWYRFPRTCFVGLLEFFLEFLLFSRSGLDYFLDVSPPQLVMGKTWMYC